MNDEPRNENGEQSPAAERTPRAPLKVVPLPLTREVSADHLEHLRTSGLSDETIKLAELYTEKFPKNIAALLRRRSYSAHCGWGLVFPFFKPGESVPHDFRVRPTTPRSEQSRSGKVRKIKYEQAPSSDALVYFTPRARAGGWYKDAARACYWTEGEKKSLVLDQLGLCCVGLTGVYNWHDRAHKDSTGEWKLHPSLVEHVAVAGRHHVIVFDADSRENEQVMTAAQRLAGVLRAAGTASVLFVCPQSTEHKGIDDYFVAFGEPATRQLLASASAIEPIDPKSPYQLARKVRALRDAPVPEGLRLPEGYEVGRDVSLWKLGDEKHGAVRIASSAMLICRLLYDYYSHEGRVELCYQRQDAWTTRAVSLRAAKDKSTMLAELGNFDSPVTSNNAAKLVDWFDDILRVNDGIVPRVACVARAGWHKVDGDRVFVLDEPLFGDSKPGTLAIDTRGDRKKLFAALTPRGTLDGHIAAINQAWLADPTCAAMVCGALAATLLEPLGAPNFAVHLSGDSSSGKTTKLKIAASVFGDPNNEQLVASWNTTSVAAELRAQTLSDLPMCFDEIGASGDAQRLEQMVYQLINGVGKARGTRELSVRETPSWRTVVLSTGERQLADETAATGAQIRVVQFSATRISGMTASQIDAMRDACAANSGRIGRAWVEAILGIDDWKPVAGVLARYTSALRAASTDPLQNRVAGFFALLMLTERMLCQKFGIGRSNGETIASLFGGDTSREVVLSVAERSVRLVRDKETSDPDAISELKRNSAGGYESKHSARPRMGFRRTDGALLLIPTELRKFFEQHKMSESVVVKEWAQRGWLERDDARRLTSRETVDSFRQRYYILLPSAGEADT